MLQKLNSILEEFALNKQIPKYLTPTAEIISTLQVPQRAAYFDRSWSELMFETDNLVDRDSGFDIRTSTTPQETFELNILNKFQNYTPIYSDGAFSERNFNSSCSIYVPSTQHRLGIRLQGCWSPIMAELSGIHSALKYSMEENIPNPLILTDSLSTLQILKDRLGTLESRTVVHQIVSMITQLLGNNQEIKLIWIPAHSKIPGNEEADRLAKFALNLQVGRRAFYSREDLKKMINNDHRSSIKLNWPFSLQPELDRYISIALPKKLIDHGSLGMTYPEEP